MFELKMGQPGSSDRANQIVIGLYASEKWEECLEMLNEFEKYEKLDVNRRNGNCWRRRWTFQNRRTRTSFKRARCCF